MPSKDHKPDQGSISRRRLLVGGTFAATTAALTATLGQPMVNDLRPTIGNLVNRGPRNATDSTRSRPTEPAAIDDAVAPGPDHVHDLVLVGGRVLDPDSGFDRTADVGIDGDRIVSIGADLRGERTVDVAGLVVAPGFIDILSYQPNPTGIWVKVADGVTTNLGMHGMHIDAETFFSTYGSEHHRPPCHYGGAFDSAFARNQLGIGTEPATAAQRRQLQEVLASELEAGWIGVDVQPEYTPWVTTDEYIALAEVAADYGVPMFFHARYSSPNDPGQDNAAAIAEVLEVARASGAAVHVDHITSTGGTHTMDTSLATLEEARSEGIDVTACLYPYDFWATFLGSARFAPGWQERFEITYEDLVVPGTGERLTEASFARHQADNTLVAAMGAIPEHDVQVGLRTPWLMVGSDAILEPGGNNHPRCAGTFSRTLGRYARDEGVIDLENAVAKMTILPARRLEQGCPALRRKGRLQLGADADITVFDPDHVSDRSTVDDPGKEATGIEWVVIGGEVVATPDGTDETHRPGQPLRYGVEA
ncbi:MAG: amidohydrolase family protein [Acidimicrobiia bacterium]|nr:amidohydrolase family protein [Acidimicrobiia bacterium]